MGNAQPRTYEPKNVEFIISVSVSLGMGDRHSFAFVRDSDGESALVLAL